MNKLISIIIPHFNRWKLINDTLKSIEEQNYNNYEIIIIDDCSTSNISILELKKIEKKYKTNKLKIIYLDKNIWPAWARNIWIKNAKWGYIFCLDSDDKIKKYTLEKSIKILEEDINIWFVYTHTKYIWSKDYIAKRPEFDISTLLIYDYIVISSLFRKKCWEKVNWFDENKNLEIEDWEFWINISKNWCKWKLLNYIGCEIFLHNESYSEIARDNLSKTLNYIQNKHKDLYENNKIIYLEYYLPKSLRKIYKNIISIIPFKIKFFLQKKIWKIIWKFNLYKK